MNEHLSAFVGYLTDKEKSKSTIESYTRYVKKFLKQNMSSCYLMHIPIRKRNII